MRGTRMAYNGWVPTWHGAVTPPRRLPLMVAHRLTGAPSFLDPQSTTGDVGLGVNPLNFVWVTRLSDRSPHEILHADPYVSWPPGRWGHG